MRVVAALTFPSTIGRIKLYWFLILCGALPPPPTYVMVDCHKSWFRSFNHQYVSPRSKRIHKRRLFASRIISVRPRLQRSLTLVGIRCCSAVRKSLTVLSAGTTYPCSLPQSQRDRYLPL